MIQLERTIDQRRRNCTRSDIKPTLNSTSTNQIKKKWNSIKKEETSGSSGQRPASLNKTSEQKVWLWKVLTVLSHLSVPLFVHFRTYRAVVGHMRGPRLHSPTFYGHQLSHEIQTIIYFLCTSTFVQSFKRYSGWLIVRLMIYIKIYFFYGFLLQQCKVINI